MIDGKGHTSEKSGQYSSIRILFWIVILTILLLGFNVFSHLEQPIGDESVHSFQINWFLQGVFEQFVYVTVVPVYHAANAIVATLLGGNSLNILRFSSLLLGALTIPAFIRLTQQFNSRQAEERSLMFVLLPIYFPLFFLVYTDFFSLAAVLLMVERTVARSFKLAGIAGLVAVFSRQPNLVWLGYCGALILLDAGKPVLTQEYLSTVMKRAWPFCIVVVLFAVYVLINGGIAAGDVEQHSMSFNPANAYFMLLTAFVMLLPLCIARVENMITLVRQHPWLIAIVVCGYFIFLQTWQITHIYNDRSLDFYRHNLVLHTINDNAWLKFLSYLAMSWMTLTIAELALAHPENKALAWLLPFGCLSVIPLPLIEQRYYLEFIALLLALLPTLDRRIIGLTLVYYVITGSYIIYNISRMNFFL